MMIINPRHHMVVSSCRWLMIGQPCKVAWQGPLRLVPGSPQACERDCSMACLRSAFAGKQPGVDGKGNSLGATSAAQLSSCNICSLQVLTEAVS